jgi:hypothetical protein
MKLKRLELWVRRELRVANDDDDVDDIDDDCECVLNI